MSVTFGAGVSLVSILQAGDLARVSPPAGHYLSAYIATTDLYQDSIQHVVIGLIECSAFWLVSNNDSYKVCEYVWQ